MLNLLPHDEDAQRLAEQTKTLAELLGQTEGRVPRLDWSKALVHMRCGQRTALDRNAKEKLLRSMGLELLDNNAGCGGVAGTFGCEADHYQVAMRVGGHELLPNARKLPKDTLLISDGFGCRCRTEHGADPWAMHLVAPLRA